MVVCGFASDSRTRGSYLSSLGSAWGAGTVAGAQGERQPSDLELEIANIQGTLYFEIIVLFIQLIEYFAGKHFYQTVSKVKF